MVNAMMYIIHKSIKLPSISTSTLSTSDQRSRGDPCRYATSMATFCLVTIYSPRNNQKHHLRFIDGLYHEDILWTTQLALVTQRVGFDDQPLYYYCANPNSITRKPNPQKEAKRIKLFANCYTTLAACR